MQDWVPGAVVGVVGSLLTWLFGWRINEAAREGAQDVRDKSAEKMGSDMRSDLREFRDEFRSAVKEIRERAALQDARAASQATTNEFTAKSIQSLVDQMERIQSKVEDHSSSIKLLIELGTRQNGK